MADVYIHNIYELQAMEDDLDGDYVLANNIDASPANPNSGNWDEEEWPGATGFRPVGSANPWFTGTIVGTGFTITGLYINRPTTDFVGLFSDMEAGSAIDVTLADVTVIGGEETGALAGYAWDVELHGISVSGSVTGKSQVGGMLGFKDEATVYAISDCHCNVTVVATTAWETGGLIGYCVGTTVSECYSTGSVTGKGSVGGLIGSPQGGIVTECYSTCDVINTGSYSGGLIGDSTGCAVSKCYATGSVTGTLFVGGLIGDHHGVTLSECYSSGQVEGTYYVGGLLGHANGDSISDCYSTSDVDGGADGTGGFIGWNLATTISKCYSVGSVTADEDIGGFCGVDDADSISDSFWDTQTSGQAASDGGTGKTTAEMKDVATFTDTDTVGLDNPWDFVGNPNDDEGNENYWDISDSYPFLTFAAPPSETVEPATLALELTQETATVAWDSSVSPTTFALVLTQDTPTVGSFCTVTPDALALALTLQTPTITFPIQTILPTTLVLALTQQTPTVFDIITVTPDVLALALTQHTPVIVWDSSVLPDTLALALTQQSSTLSYDWTVLVSDAFALALTQQISVTAWDSSVSPITLALALTEQTPTIALGVTVLTDTLELALTLQSSITVSNIVIVLPDTLALALSLQTPTIALPLWIILPDTFTLEAALLIPYAVIGYTEMTPAMHAALIDPYSGGAWLWLCEISIPGYETIKLARNTENVVYACNTYTKNNFDVGLAPLTGDGSVPRIMLRVAQDADYTLEDKINATQGAGGGSVKIIRTHEDFLTEFIEELEQNVSILKANSDTEHVIFSLGIPDPLIKKIPIRRYSSKACSYALPSLFRGPECQYSGDDNTCTGKFEDCYAKGNIVHWGGELGLDPNTTRI